MEKNKQTAEDYLSNLIAFMEMGYFKEVPIDFLKSHLNSIVNNGQQLFSMEQSDN